MITHWNEICQQIELADKKLDEFIEKAGLSASQLKRLQKYTSELNKVKKLANAFDEFLAPVDPIAIESPFDQDDFRYIWKTWKEYNQEQHGRLMRSRMEQMSLHYLAEISENNPDVAIGYLRFAMANGYRSFFKVEAKDKTTPPKANKNGSDY
jgi:plasmid replication initiation protein